MDKIIDGKLVSAILKEKLKDKISNLDKKLKLVVIQVGNNEASNIYISKKEQLCKEMNIDFECLKYEMIEEKELIDIIKDLNNDIDVTSILVQLPLPNNLNEINAINSIDYRKDVDGLTSINIGKLYTKENSIVPCTALGIMELLKYYNVPLEGKRVSLIGRTKLVNIPLFKLLLDQNCTVTMCHSKTNDLKEITKNSDIIISATGVKHLINKEFIKENSIIIDVGITRVDGKLFGDVDFDDCINKVSLITPVPGGVGPMTVVMLINNIIECYKLQK